MHSFLLTAIGLTLLLVGAGMVLLETAALKARRRFFKNNYTRQSYWMTYLSAFVLGATVLIKAVTVAM